MEERSDELRELIYETLICDWRALTCTSRTRALAGVPIGVSGGVAIVLAFPAVRAAERSNVAVLSSGARDAVRMFVMCGLCGDERC